MAFEKAVAGSGDRGGATQEVASCGLVSGQLAAWSWVRRRNCWKRDGFVPGACAGRMRGTRGATSGLGGLGVVAAVGASSCAREDPRAAEAAGAAGAADAAAAVTAAGAAVAAVAVVRGPVLLGATWPCSAGDAGTTFLLPASDGAPTLLGKRVSLGAGWEVVSAVFRWRDAEGVERPTGWGP